MKTLLYILLAGCLSQRMVMLPNVEQPQMLIHEMQIQSMYNEEVEVDIHLPTTYLIEDIQVVCKAKGVADKVETVNWTLADRRWQTRLTVKEGMDMQYVLYDVQQQKTVYTSHMFSVDTTKPKLHIEWKEKEITTLPAAFASSGWIAFYFTDAKLHASSVQISMLEDGIQISPVIRENKVYFYMKEGHTYIVNASAKDEAGNHEAFTNAASPLSIDTSAPNVWLSIHDQICTELQYQLFRPEQVAIYVEDEHFLATQSHIYVNGEEINSDWERYKQGWRKTWMCEQSGDYHIQYDIVDTAGNRTKKKAMHILQDLDVPQIKMLANEVEIQDLPNMFNQKQNIIWYIQEANLNELESFFMLDDKQISLHKLDATTYRVSFSISQGKHAIQAMFKDKGGRFVKYQKDIQVDDVRPVLRMNALPSYSDSHMVLQLQLADQSMSVNDLLLNIKKDGKDLMVSKWEEKGDGVFEYQTLLEEGEYTLHVSGKDLAGNALEIFEGDMYQGETFTKRFIVDTTAPIVSIDRKHLNSYINTEQQVMIRVDDAYAGLDQLHVQIKKDGEPYNIMPIKKDHTLLYTLEEDGMYTFALHMVDYAGNQAIFRQGDGSSNGTLAFTIDQHLPKIQLQGISSGSMVQHALTLQLNVLEKNQKKCQIHIERNGERQFFDCKSQMQFQESEGDIGNYRLFVKAEDKAGNYTETTPVTFVIDRKKPVIQGVVNQRIIENQARYVRNQTVKLHMQIWDDHLKSSQLIIKKDGKMVENIVNTPQSEYILNAIHGERHVYEIIAEGIDKADNFVTFTTTFIMDAQTPLPKLNLDELNISAAISSWTPELAKDTPYTMVGYSLKRNQQVVDYVWGTPIEEEGNYILDVIVADEAMNIAHLQDPVSFEIDKTAPNIMLRQHGREIGQYDLIEQEALEVYIQQEDLGKIAKESFEIIQINQVEITDWKRDSLGNASYKFTPSKGHVSIYVKAVDEAGNIAEKHWDLQVVNQRLIPFRVICYISVLCIGMSMVVYYVKQRKKACNLSL